MYQKIWPNSFKLRSKINNTYPNSTIVALKEISKDILNPIYKRSNDKKGIADKNFAARKIQSLFIIFTYKKELVIKNRGKTIINKKSCELISHLGVNLCGRYQIVSLYFFKDTQQIKLNLFDIVLNFSQEFHIGNNSFENFSESAVQEQLMKTLKRISFNKDKNLYVMLNERTVKEMEKQINTVEHLVEENVESGKLQKQSVYKDKKLILRTAYVIEIFFISEQRFEAVATKVSDSTAKYRITVDYDFSSFCTADNLVEKEAIGKIVFESVTTKISGELVVDVAELRKKMGISTTKQKIKSILKLQSKHKNRLALLCITQSLLKTDRQRILLDQFGMQIGPKLHYMKLLYNKKTPDIVILKSNVAANEIELPLKQLIVPEKLVEGIESYNVRRHLKYRVPKLVAYEPAKKLLLFYVRESISKYSNKSSNIFFKNTF